MSAAQTAVTVPQSITELKTLPYPQLKYLSNAPDDGAAFVDDAESMLVIENQNCHEAFYGFVPNAFSRFAAPSRFENLHHVPCMSRAVQKGDTSVDIKIDVELSADSTDRESLWCLFRESGNVKFAVRRQYTGKGRIPKPHLEECRYLLNVLQTQAQPLTVAVAVKNDESSNSSGPYPTAPMMNGVPLPTTKAPETVFALDGTTLTARAASGGYCEDSFSGFKELALPDATKLTKRLKKVGFKRCAYESGAVSKLSITGKYRLKSMLFSEDEGEFVLECKFQELRVHDPKDAMSIELLRRAPIRDSEKIDKPTRDFNKRMQYRSKVTQRNECITMLNTFITVQNSFFKHELKNQDLTQVLLPSLDSSDDTQSIPKDSKDVSGGLSFGIIMLIVTLVFVVLMGGFFLWRRHSRAVNPKPVGRKPLSQPIV